MSGASAAGRRRRVEVAVDRMVPRSLGRYREQLLYLAGGAWNTLFGYGVWALLQYLLYPRVNYLVIVVLSYPIAIANAYVCYRYIVFRSHGSVLRELPRFSSVYVLTMVANLAALPILVRVLPLNLYAIQALFTMVVVILSYLGHKFFSFRGGQEANSEVRN